MFKDEDSKAAQETIISFKKPIFLDHLRDYYRYHSEGSGLSSKIIKHFSCSNCKFADTTIICSDETRLVWLMYFGKKVDTRFSQTGAQFCPGSRKQSDEGDLRRPRHQDPRHRPHHPDAGYQGSRVGCSSTSSLRPG